MHGVSAYDLLGLPGSLRLYFVGAAALLTAAPHIPRQRVGGLWVPRFKPRAARIFKWGGPLLLITSLAAFAPLWPGARSEAKVFMLADDLRFDLRDPYERRQSTLPVQIHVEVTSGSVALGRGAKLLRTDIDRDYFVDTVGRVELVEAEPSSQIVAVGKPATIKLVFDTSSLIPKAYYATEYEAFAGKTFGTIRVSIGVKDDVGERVVPVEIPLRFSD